MADIQASIQNAVAASEGRTSHAVDALRADLTAWRQDFMPRERIEDRWHRDDKRLEEHDRAIDALQTGQADLQRAVQLLATKEDVQSAVQAATSGLPSKVDVQQLIAEGHKARVTTWQQLGFISLGVLGFLTTTGIIHPLALFIGH